MIVADRAMKVCGQQQPCMHARANRSLLYATEAWPCRGDMLRFAARGEDVSRRDPLRGLPGVRSRELGIAGRLLPACCMRLLPVGVKAGELLPLVAPSLRPLRLA